MAAMDNQQSAPNHYDRWRKADNALLEAMQWGDAKGIAQASQELEQARTEMSQHDSIG